MVSEKFCLRWNDFESNISTAFRELRDDKDFFDVTLACDDEQIQAHKVILSGCSPFFRNIFRRNPHQHPLLYLKGVKYTDMQAVLNFMYQGEVSVAQEELNSFLSVAEELKVKGLTQNDSSSHQTKTNSPPLKPEGAGVKESYKQPPLPRHTQPAPAVRVEEVHAETDIQEVVPIKSEPRDPPSQTRTPLVAPTHMYSNIHQTVAGDTTEEHSVAPYQEEAGYEEYEHYQYEDDISMSAQDKGFANVQSPEDLQQYINKDSNTKESCCTLCTFRSKIPALVKNHLEGVHFSGVFTYSCELCDKTCNGKNALRVHNSKFHSKKAANRF